MKNWGGWLMLFCVLLVIASYRITDNKDWVVLIQMAGVFFFCVGGVAWATYPDKKG